MLPSYITYNPGSTGPYPSDPNYYDAKLDQDFGAYTWYLGSTTFYANPTAVPPPEEATVTPLFGLVHYIYNNISGYAQHAGVNTYFDNGSGGTITNRNAYEVATLFVTQFPSTIWNGSFYAPVSIKILSDPSGIFLIGYQPASQTNYQVREHSYPIQYTIDGAYGLYARAGYDFATSSQTSYPVTIGFEGEDGIDRVAVLTINVDPTPKPPTDITLSKASIDENSKAGAVVGVVGIVDPDGATVAPIVEADNQSPFEVVTQNGQYLLELKAGHTLDYETQATYQVPITVISQDTAAIFGQTLTKTFTITVNDVEEPPTTPTLSKTVFRASEGAGATVATISATDPDQGDGVTYSASDPSGTLTVQGNQLEIASAAVSNPVTTVLPVTITATDNSGLSTSAKYNITDLGPNLPPTNLALSVKSVVDDIPPGGVIGSLLTTDPDPAPLYESFTYNLVDDPSGLFAIQGSALVLRTGKMLDANLASTESVTVAVTDSAGHTLTKALSFGVTAAPTHEVLGDDLFGTVLVGGQHDVLNGGIGDDTFIITGTPSRLDGVGGYNTLVTDQDRVVDGSTIRDINEYHTAPGYSLSFINQTEHFIGSDGAGVAVFVTPDAGPSGDEPTTVSGTPFSDTLINHSDQPASFSGGDGDDWLFANAGDTLIGGAGDDVMVVNGAPAYVDGGDGLDTLAIAGGTAALNAADIVNIEYFQARSATLSFIGFDHGVDVIATNEFGPGSTVTGTAHDDKIALEGVGNTVNVTPDGSTDTIIGFTVGKPGDVLNFQAAAGLSSFHDLMATAKDYGNGSIFSIGQGAEFDLGAAYGNSKLILPDLTLNWLSAANVHFS